MNFKDEHVRRHFLVASNLEDVSLLDAAPVRDLERRSAPIEHKPLDRFRVDLAGGLAPFSIGQEVHQACDNGTDNQRGDEFRVLIDPGPAGIVAQRAVEEQDQVVEGEGHIVGELQDPHRTLHVNKLRVILIHKDMCKFCKFLVAKILSLQLRSL